MPKHTKKSYQASSSEAQKHRSKNIKKGDAQEATTLNLQSATTSIEINDTSSDFDTSYSSDNDDYFETDNVLVNEQREELYRFFAIMLKKDKVNQNEQDQRVMNLNRDQLEGSSQPPADVISLKQRGSTDIPYKSKVEKSGMKRKTIIESQSFDCTTKRSKAESSTGTKEARYGHSSKNLDCLPHKLSRNLEKEKAKRNKERSSKNPSRTASAAPPKLIPVVPPKRMQIQDSDASHPFATAETRRNMYLGRRPPTPYSRRLVSSEEENMVGMSGDTSSDESTAQNAPDIEAASWNQQNESSPETLHFPCEGMTDIQYETVQSFNVAADPTPIKPSVVISPSSHYIPSLPSSSSSDNQENGTQFDVSINEVLQHIEKLLVSQANMKLTSGQHHGAGPSKSRQQNQTRDKRFAASRSRASREQRPTSQMQHLKRRDKPYPSSKQNSSAAAVGAPIASKSLTSKAKPKSYYNHVFATNILSYGIPNASPIKIDSSSPIPEFNKWWNDNCKHFYKSEEAAQKRYRLARAIIERSIRRNDENLSEDSSSNTNSNSNMLQVQSPPIITHQILSSPRPIRPVPRAAIKEAQASSCDSVRNVRKNDSRNKKGGNSKLRGNTYMPPNHASAFTSTSAVVPRKRPLRRELFPDPPVDMCGVTLTREDYYTIPAVADLALHKSLDGRCIIKGFIVGRFDYGHVYFPEPIDVTGLNLDEIVHFEMGAITIYPNDYQKPPVGEGLNRLAHVSLENVFPKSESGVEIRDVKTLLHMDYTSNLRSICERNGLKFISYVPGNGTWVFTVKHFCTYGLEENDSNEGNQAESIVVINKEKDENSFENFEKCSFIEAELKN